MLSIIEARLGFAHGSAVLAQYCLSSVDADQDGSISRLELLDFFADEAEIGQAIEAAEKASAKIEYG